MGKSKLRKIIKEYISEIMLNETPTSTLDEGPITAGACCRKCFLVRKDHGKCPCCSKSSSSIDWYDSRTFTPSSDKYLTTENTLNEGPYCNPDGTNAADVAGCHDIGVGCLGDGYFGVMGYCGGCDDQWACVSVSPPGTGGDEPLSGDELVTKTRGGNNKPSIDKMMREAAKDIIKNK